MEYETKKREKEEMVLLRAAQAKRQKEQDDSMAEPTPAVDESVKRDKKDKEKLDANLKGMSKKDRKAYEKRMKEHAESQANQIIYEKKQKE